MQQHNYTFLRQYPESFQVHVQTDYIHPVHHNGLNWLIKPHRKEILIDNSGMGPYVSILNAHRSLFVLLTLSLLTLFWGFYLRFQNSNLVQATQQRLGLIPSSIQKYLRETNFNLLRNVKVYLGQSLPSLVKKVIFLDSLCRLR